MFSRGDKLGEYEVIAPLRAGGMAMLYLARRRGVGGFSRLVALKLVHSHLADDATINRMFLQEARITASVAHPNVVNVEEVGKADGHYFMAMEYVHGVSLAELLSSLQKRRRRMSSKLCVWVAAQVAEALHAAHDAKSERGTPLQIVHRDVSPQNVLIGHTGHVKLIDFGIAKSQPTSHHATGGAVLGKLGYMAPEQLRLDSVDRRTDVYGLGVMFWEMLTSRSLFRCIRIDDERDWATRESPPPPSRYSRISTPALDRVALKAIAFDPKERYANALEFRAALLSAETAAAEVDAPRFAALMCTMLGDELERRRASWPNEVNVELDIDTETTSRALNISELTVNFRSSEAENARGQDDEEPITVKGSPTALRSVRLGDGIFEMASEGSANRPASELALSTQAVTELATGESALYATSKRRSLRAIALGALCVGLASGAVPDPKPSTKAESRSALSSSLMVGPVAIAEDSRPAAWLRVSGKNRPPLAVKAKGAAAAAELPHRVDDVARTASPAPTSAREDRGASVTRRVVKDAIGGQGKGRKSSGGKGKSRALRRSSSR